MTILDEIYTKIELDKTFLIDNESVEGIETVEKLHYQYNIYKENNFVILESPNILKPSVYYFKQGNYFALSNSVVRLIHHIESKGFTPIIDSELLKNWFKIYGKDNGDGTSRVTTSVSLKIIEPFENIKIIRNWTRIKVNESSISIEEVDVSKYLAVPIKDSFEILNKWISKYKNYLSKNRYMPTLTAGIDSRILTYFWRDDESIKTVRCKKQKSYTHHYYDGYLATYVLNKLKRDDIKLIEKKNAPLLSGYGTEVYRCHNKYSTEQRINKFTNHLNCYSAIFYTSHTYPFLDDLFIRIAPEEKDLLHTCLLLWLAPDLLDIPFHTIEDMPIYRTDKLPLRKAEQILKIWGI